MAIDRELDKVIENHYSGSRNALLLTGARQTGKTFAIRRYAERKGLRLVEVNFVTNPKAADVFEGAKDAAEVLLRLSAMTGAPLSEQRSLIFFDEVQRCPEAVTWVKFLVDEGSHLYALSGSLLGVELTDLRSVPVGYMRVVDVFPLTLREFALAVGVPRGVLDSVRQSFEEGRPVDNVVHDNLLRVVALYVVVGGMPAVVQTYCDTNDMSAVVRKQREIVGLYRWDVSQYDKDKKLNIKEIFDVVPSELDAKNKRFVMKTLNARARFSRYEDGFLWLKDAGVALPTYNVQEPRVPLRLNEQRNLFKLFMNDVGLLASQYADGLAFEILRGNVAMNHGAIFENLVAQELAAQGYALHYFNSKSQGELDFVIERGGRVVPIEVKSGKDYERHNALSNVMADEAYGIETAYVFCQGNVSRRGKVTYVPIYMTMFAFARQDVESPHIFRLDLSGLA